MQKKATEATFLHLSHLSLFSRLSLGQAAEEYKMERHKKKRCSNKSSTTIPVGSPINRRLAVLDEIIVGGTEVDATVKAAIDGQR